MKPEHAFPAHWLAPLRAAVALLCAVTLVTSALPAWAQQASPTTAAKNVTAEMPLIAVLDMEAVGATEPQASALTDRLREELLNSGRYTLVDRSQMKAILNEQAFQQTGCTSTECAVKAGQILGVRQIVTSKITKAESGLWLLSAQITDVETARTLSAVSVTYQGDYVGVLSEGIVMLAAKLTGETPPVETMVKAPPAPPPAAAPEQQAAAKESGISGWWWVAIGAAAVGAAVAARHNSSSSGSSGSGNGSVTISW